MKTPTLIKPTYIYKLKFAPGFWGFGVLLQPAPVVCRISQRPESYAQTSRPPRLQARLAPRLFTETRQAVVPNQAKGDEDDATPIPRKQHECKPTPIPQRVSARAVDY